MNAPTQASSAATEPARKPVSRQTLLIAGVLVALTLAAYWGIWSYGYVDYDDFGYAAENPHVARGLMWENLDWAFSTGAQSNWHPLTWMSYMLDVTLFGNDAGPHHMVNLLIHIANAVLLFFLLKKMTAAEWPSAVVAALFAVHPLHVESVAWIAERKDVLSVLFGFLATLAYVAYTERQTAARYGVVFGLLALSLMAKPMLVTLPLVFLLLDYWPLGRLWKSKAEPGGLSPALEFWLRVREKIPLLALSAASSAVTYAVQQRGGSVVPSDKLVLDERVQNALLGYVGYLWKAVWPESLAVLYPLNPIENAGEVVAAAAILLAITGAVVWGAWRGRRYLAVGWFWFLGTLVPAVGLVQVGSQAMADRYTYVPLIGIFILAAWGLLEWVPRRRFGPAALGVVAAAAVVACAAQTHRQVQYWADSESLYLRALELTTRNAVAHNNLGQVYYKKGDIEKAVEHIRKAIRIWPDNGDFYNNLGLVLDKQGRRDEAMAAYQRAVKLSPKLAESHINVGTALAEKKQYPEAIAEFQVAIRINPDDLRARNNLGNALLSSGRLDEAVACFREILRLDSNMAEPHNDLGFTLLQQGIVEEAVAQFKEALRLKPEMPKPYSNLAKIRAACSDAAFRNGAEAVELATRACELTGHKDPSMLEILATAYAEAGRFPEAVATAKQAADLAASLDNRDLAAQIQNRIRKYEAGRPIRIVFGARKPQD